MLTYWRRLENYLSKTAETEEVWTPAEDARPSATESTAAVQTERKEEVARRVDGCHQQRPD